MDAVKQISSHSIGNMQTVIHLLPEEEFPVHTTVIYLTESSCFSYSF